MGSRSRSVDPGAKANRVLDESSRATAAEVEDSIDNLYEALGGKVNDLNLHLN